MIKITLEFTSVDAAIVALGKLVVAAPKKDSVAPAKPAPVVSLPTPGPEPVVTEPKPTAKRAPRADKGVPRGPYKKDVAAPDSADGGAAPAVPATPVAPEPLGQEPGAAAPTATLADCQKALEKMHDKVGLQPCLDLLARYGVKRVRDLLPKQYAEFAAEAGSQ